MLRTALALYMDGGGVALPLPTHEEVLVCNQATTTEEVGNLIPRPASPILRPNELMFILCSRLLCCGSVPLVTQASGESSASFMPRSCPTRSQTKPYDP